jgi:polyvinyl alcohol dehydrogenase (cytochrome)
MRSLCRRRNFDPKLGGGLTALSAETGEKVWFAPGHPCVPAGPDAVGAAGAVSHSGCGIAGSMDGHVRAFSTADGKVLWDADTARLQGGEWRSGKGGAQWRRSRHRRRHGVRELWLSAPGRDAR